MGTAAIGVGPFGMTRNPWWIPPFLGRVPAGLEASHLRLLGLVALALFIEEYDLAMLTAALKHIAAELGMREGDFGLYLGLIRLGSVPAFLVIPFADRIGRRLVFLVALGVTAFATFLTAFAQTPMQFVLLQMATRTFFVSGAAIAFVMIAEEFPAAQRGWGIGMLGALGACGHGLGALLFALVDHLPYGWRALYAVGIVPLVFLPVFWTRLPETKRFEAYRASLDLSVVRSRLFAFIEPLRGLALTHPSRALGVALVAFLPAIGLFSAFQFTGYYTQNVHGWSPAQYSTMVIVGGGIGIIGNVVAGRLGDRLGRRYVGFVLLGLFPLFVTVFYRGPSWILPVVWVAFVFCSQGGRVMLRALSTELFPTSHRSAASGLYTILETAGAALGLFLLWFGSEQPGDLARIVPYLSGVVLLGAIILLLFPETRQRELEDISE
jgi:MFS family permease